MTRPARLAGSLALASLLAAISALGDAAGVSRFDHWQHRRLLPSCLSCHGGMAKADQPIWPAPSSCATCHDGRAQKNVDWRPPVGVASNLRFTHLHHAEQLAVHTPDSALACIACHAEAAAPWMQISRTLSQRCLDCHGVAADHLAAPDTACATCHLTLAEAAGISRDRTTCPVS